MNEICIKPWTDLFMFMNNCKFCCFTDATIATYQPFRPSFEWNGIKMQQIRKEMLTNGYRKTCPHCPHVTRGSLEDQMAGEVAEWPSKMTAVILDEIKNGSLTSSGPIIMSVTTGARCNSYCRMCWFREFPAETLTRLTDLECVRMLPHSENVDLGGGDLFALSDSLIEEYLDIFSKSDIYVITNGRGITVDRMQKYLLNDRITGVRISLETVNAEAYQMHCNIGLGDLLTHLRILNGYRVKCYSSVVTAWTLPHLPELIDFARETNVKTVVINPYQGTALEHTGFGYANIFGEGYSDENYDLALDMATFFNHVTDVNILGFDNVIRRLKARKYQDA